MKNKITVSAPGKLMLFGEHAVVHGRPCIVSAVSQRLILKAKLLEEKVFHLNAVDVGVLDYKKNLGELGEGEILKGARFIEIATLNFNKKFKLRNGVYFETVSEFKSTFGFGSSSAAAVCAIRALSELTGIKITNRQTFDLAYKTVLDIQGVGSGFDLAAEIYGGTLYFVRGGKVLKQLNTGDFNLIVGYTGIKADTATIVKQVNERAKKFPKIYESIFDEIENVTILANKALKKADIEGLGELMNINQGYLESLGVGSKELSNLIYTARNAGAYGAKLSGAGGGDCMIALAPPSRRKAVEKAIEKEGGQVLKVEVNAEGVRIEK